ncbi:molecular chaperone [Arsenophonus nasoniae]|uniref:Cytoplasmic chaperone TorD family protein n=1 Tax=Arsenophonus nasoniae TaxID=638 RepID=D2TVZ3_9GAMM|nr:molecular chaperone [Arsenophonus nasoniae]QBY43058.1 Tat proofreading chaperone DmsD [Arsenophonus nasoniae]WGM07091.1 molecular chaperone [Arsenophonus nasoniae]WGM11970.1 molecular chaperone [Arsenophonus nasoniae]WGM16654.1 molecular chaperone [Arsenophonus nasoniae]CBA71523.1 cytoplasmic chaperone TorD family protein [Arsenophonus nasoniae]
MLLNTSILRILGACFYYSPDSPSVKSLIPLMPFLVELFPWPDSQKIKKLTKEIAKQDFKLLYYDFSILFEGQGNVPAPPWGSVYLDPEKIVMRISTQAYQQFLSLHSIAVESDQNEPTDQFGLMLLAAVYLLERNKKIIAIELIEQHLLPWAYRYLSLIQMTKLEHTFYRNLAAISEEYLKTIEQQLNLIAPKRQLFH